MDLDNQEQDSNIEILAPSTRKRKTPRIGLSEVLFKRIFDSGSQKGFLPKQAIKEDGNCYRRSNILIHDNVPRNQWKMDVVTILHQGKDALIRRVSLKVRTGKELLRPTEK